MSAHTHTACGLHAAPGHREGARARQSGLALVAVLWMVGALALLVGGLTSIARTETHAAQAAVGLARTAALADAAIQLAVLDLRTNPAMPARWAVRTYVVEGVELVVRLQSATGFVDLNAAPEALLTDLLRIAGGLDAATADRLAQRIIDWRDEDQVPLPQGAEEESYVAAGVAYRPRNGRFVVVEDLLQVLGFDFDIFDRVRGLLTVWSPAGQGVDPLAAADDILLVLAGGDRELAAGIAARRNAGDVTIDTTALRHVGPSSDSADTLRIEAQIVHPDGSRGTRARWVSLASDDEGRPWMTLWVEQVAFSNGSGGGL